MSLSQTPPEIHNFDLVIVGGGLAGLCAAIAAARDGAKVGLVQDRPVFGGNCSSEIRVVPHGANHSNAWAGETGLPLALTLEDRVTNHEAFPDHGMINSHFDFTLLEAAHREPNLTFFLNAHVNAVESEPVSVVETAQPVATSNGLGRLGGEARRIIAVVATQMGSEKTLRLVARQFVDATGDGTIGFLAGADYRYGREGRAEFDEPLAPVVADDVTMGATITMRARDVGQPIKFEAPPWIERYEKASDIGFKRTLYHITQPVYGGYWWLEVCNPFHQIDDNAAIRHELHRHVLGVWNFIKNHSDFQEHADTYALDWIGMIPGKRESRRLMGDIVLTEHDCHTDRAWLDAIGFAGWWIDLHIKGGILNKVDPGERENADRNYKHWIRIPVFTLPLRAFYSRNIENLWMAGRCFSATHVALGPARVMQTLGQIGQAIGSAAAHALREDILPREMASPDGPHIGRLQQHLLRNDVRLPGLRNYDPDDLARDAHVSASSEATLATIEQGSSATYRLGIVPPPGSMASPGLAMVIPLTETKLESAAFHLRSESEKVQRIEIIVQPLDRIWDRAADQPIVAKASIEIPAGASGWFAATFDTIVEPGRPYRIALVGGENICWTEAIEWPVGTVMQYLHISPGGPEPQNAHLDAYAVEEVSIPAYRHWRQLRTALAMQISPTQHCYGAGNINNGAAWPDALPNLWRSDPSQALPQHLELKFEQEISIARVQLSFDTNLARANQSEAPFFRAPECARDWRILAKKADGWEEIYRETDNYQRHRIAVFDTVNTTAIRIEVMSTNGIAEARIFEVRAYGA